MQILIVVLMVVVILLQLEARLRRVLTKPAARTTPHEIELAVFAACAAVGLNASALTLASDLQSTGKMQEVLHIAARHLGRNPELRTVQDVCDWLAEAPSHAP